MKNRLNPFLFLSCTFKISAFGDFFSTLWKNFIFFAGIMDLFQTSFLAPYILKILWQNVWKLKILPITFLKLPEQCTKIKLENLLLMTSVEKTSYFEVALSYHANKHTLIIYLKNKYPNLLYSSLKISCLRNVQNFIDVP